MLDNQLWDGQLPLCEAAAGDEEAFSHIVQRMMPLIHAQVRHFRCIGIEDEDLAQEALLGLLAAVRSFRPEGGAVFTTYATACIRHRLTSVVRQNGDRLLREHPLEEEPELADVTGDPALRVQAQEEATALLQQLQERLTPLEYKVLLLRLSNLSYREIACRMQVSEKAVDNAVQRLRRKLSATLSGRA